MREIGIGGWGNGYIETSIFPICDGNGPFCTFGVMEVVLKERLHHTEQSLHFISFPPSPNLVSRTALVTEISGYTSHDYMLRVRGV